MMPMFATYAIILGAVAGASARHVGYAGNFGGLEARRLAQAGGALGGLAHSGTSFHSIRHSAPAGAGPSPPVPGAFRPLAAPSPPVPGGPVRPLAAPRPPVPGGPARPLAAPVIAAAATGTAASHYSPPPAPAPPALKQVGVAQMERVIYVQQPVVNVNYVQEPVVSYVTRPVKSVSFVPRRVVTYSHHPVLAVAHRPAALLGQPVATPVALPHEPFGVAASRIGGPVGPVGLPHGLLGPASFVHGGHGHGLGPTHAAPALVGGLGHAAVDASHGRGVWKKA